PNFGDRQVLVEGQGFNDLVRPLILIPFWTLKGLDVLLDIGRASALRMALAVLLGPRSTEPYQGDDEDDDSSEIFCSEPPLPHPPSDPLQPKSNECPGGRDGWGCLSSK